MCVFVYVHEAAAAGNCNSKLDGFDTLNGWHFEMARHGFLYSWWLKTLWPISKRYCCNEKEEKEKMFSGHLYRDVMIKVKIYVGIEQNKSCWLTLNLLWLHSLS